jgi:hypothetical protein
VIEAGRLVRQQSMDDATAVDGVMLVEATGDPAALLKSLAAHGVRGSQHGARVELLTDADDHTPARVADLVRDAVADAGEGLVRLQPRRRSMSQLFDAEPSDV